MKKEKVLPIRLSEESHNRLTQLQQLHQIKTGVKISRAEIILRLVDFAFYEDISNLEVFSKRHINEFGDLMHFTDK